MRTGCRDYSGDSRVEPQRKEVTEGGLVQCSVVSGPKFFLCCCSAMSGNHIIIFYFSHASQLFKVSCLFFVCFWSLLTLPEFKSNLTHLLLYSKYLDHSWNTVGPNISWRNQWISDGYTTSGDCKPRDQWQSLAGKYQVLLGGAEEYYRAVVADGVVVATVRNDGAEKQQKRQEGHDWMWWSSNLVNLVIDLFVKTLKISSGILAYLGL